ncbi:hypothetical protein LCGC14_2969490, partial [marine sediment metagenome]
FMHNGDPGTASFDDRATRSFEQGLDSPPFNIDGDRIGENSGQDFSMIAVHSQYGITFCHHVKLEMIKVMKARNSIAYAYDKKLEANRRMK